MGVRQSDDIGLTLVYPSAALADARDAAIGAGGFIAVIARLHIQQQRVQPRASVARTNDGDSEFGEKRGEILCGTLYAEQHLQPLCHGARFTEIVFLLQAYAFLAHLRTRRIADRTTRQLEELSAQE